MSFWRRHRWNRRFLLGSRVRGDGRALARRSPIESPSVLGRSREDAHAHGRAVGCDRADGAAKLAAERRVVPPDAVDADGRGEARGGDAAGDQLPEPRPHRRGRARSPDGHPAQRGHPAWPGDELVVGLETTALRPDDRRCPRLDRRHAAAGAGDRRRRVRLGERRDGRVSARWRSCSASAIGADRTCGDRGSRSSAPPRRGKKRAPAGARFAVRGRKIPARCSVLISTGVRRRSRNVVSEKASLDSTGSGRTGVRTAVASAQAKSLPTGPGHDDSAVAAAAQQDPYLTDIPARPAVVDPAGPDGTTLTSSADAAAVVRPDDRAERFTVTGGDVVPAGDDGFALEWDEGFTIGLGAIAIALALGFAVAFLRRPRVAL